MSFPVERCAKCFSLLKSLGAAHGLSCSWRAEPAVTLKICALVAILGIAASCGPKSPKPKRDDTALVAAIVEVEAGRKTTPLIVQPTQGGDVTVTFLAKSAKGQVPRIVSDVTGWGENAAADTFDVSAGTMTRIGSTDWYSLDAQVAPGARIEYMIVQGQTDYHLDPHNLRQSGFRGGDPVSEFVTTGYVPPQEFTDPPVASSGKTTEATIESRALDGSRRVIVYTPPGYRRNGAYPVAVFHAGWGVVQVGEGPRLLDWLIAHREIEPIVAVFLDSHRLGDLDFHEGKPMRTFLNHEVPAWIASHFGVTKRADKRAILAISFGAKDALDAAIQPTGAYGCLGLLIPGRRIRPTDLDAIALQKSRRLRVAILAGRYDRSNIATARAARKALTDTGHIVEYFEVPEGHNLSTWRNHLKDVLVSLFGTRDTQPRDP